ncbi:MAG: CDP-alcohol phosphatidyltransferase family protein [Pseudomonadales bacterium]
MLDSTLRPIIDPLLNKAATTVAKTTLSANQVTVAGFLVGLTCLPAIALEQYTLGLVLLLCNRVLDGLDGALARLRGSTDLGAYLDIVLDFIVYSAVVFGFCLAQPTVALYGAFLIFSFVGSGTAFLAFAILAEKRGISTEAQGKKTIYYLSGIAEGFETILALGLMCLIPGQFWLIALVFGLICWLSTAGRIATAVKTLK